MRFNVSVEWTATGYGCGFSVAEVIEAPDARTAMALRLLTFRPGSYPPPSNDLRLLAKELPADKAYPYPYDGDVEVLGPEIFAAHDGSVICWRGQNYVPQETPDVPEAADDA